MRSLNTPCARSGIGSTTRLLDIHHLPLVSRGESIRYGCNIMSVPVWLEMGKDGGFNFFNDHSVEFLNEFLQWISSMITA